MRSRLLRSILACALAATVTTVIQVLAPAAAGAAGWTQTTSVSNAQWDVACASTTACWSVGIGTAISFTSNGGATWSTQTSAATYGVTTISCPSSSICYAVGPSDFVKTVNGGSTWTRTARGGSTPNSISCSTTTTCVMVGYTGFVSVTTDGGTTWTDRTATSSTTQRLNGVSCWSTTVCIAVGDNVIIRSGDGGNNWTITSAPTTPTFYDISCPTSTFCYAASSSGVYETADGGGSWLVRTAAASITSASISCTDSDTCWVPRSGTHAFAGTTDGAQTWAQYTLQTTYEFHAVACPAPGTCVAAAYDPNGTGGALWHLAAAAPNTPTNVGAKPGTGTAYVTWTRPADNGAPLSGFTITASPGGQTTTAPGSAIGWSVDNLTPGGSYTFTVTAANGAGTSPASSPTAPMVASSTIDSATDAPDPVAVGSPITFTVSWTDEGHIDHAVVCKTNAISAATCSGGTWATSATTGNWSATATYTPTQADVGTRSYYAFACDTSNVCTPSLSGTFTVSNVAPVLNSASVSPSSANVGDTLTFNANWTDAGDSARVVVCKTNSISSTATCPGGAYTTGSVGTANPATAAYTAQQGDVGTKTYYAFVCDASNACSASASGTFAVSNVLPGITSASVSPPTAAVGTATTFAVGWTDAGDTDRAVVCRTNAISNGTCPGGVLAASANGTANPATATYTVQQSDIGTQSWYAFACDSANACSSSLSGTLTVVNNAPSITSASVSPSAAAAGTALTWSVGWSDPGDTETAVVCKTNAASGGTCPGGAWATGASTAVSPATATGTSSEADLGTDNWYAFVCDSLGACSPSLSGSFSVTNRAPSITSLSVPSTPVGSAVQFTVGWNDPTDTERVLICTTGSLSGANCAAAAWAVSAPSQTTPTVASTGTTTQSDVGTHAYYAFVCDSQNACSTTWSGVFTVVDAAPSITSASVTPTAVVAGDPVTFNVGWTDYTDADRAVVCRTNAVSAGSCTGGTWAVGSFGSTGTSTATGSTVQSDVGSPAWYAFACDRSNVCSPALSGTLTVANGTPTITSASLSPATVTAGGPVTFSAGWTDPTDTERAVVCKTDAIVNATCTGGAWATGASTTTTPATAVGYPPESSLGANTGYVFICDSANACTTSLPVTFTVVNRTPTATATSASPSPVKAGSTVTFNVGWYDPTDTEQVFVCKTDSLSNGACTGGAWASNPSLTAGNPATASYTTTTDDAGVHSYYAFVCDSQGACSSSAAGTFTVWAVSLSADTQTPTVDGTATLTATADGNVYGTGFVIEVYDVTSPARVAVCSTGTTCSVGVTQTGSGAHSYVAYVGLSTTSRPLSPQAQSDPLPVEWGVPLAVTLSAASQVTTVGSPVTLLATATRSPDTVGMVIEIFDVTTNELVGSCLAGQTCSTGVVETTATTHSFVAYFAPLSSTSPPPAVQAQSSSVSVTWL